MEGGAAQSHLGFPMGWNLHPGNSSILPVKDKGRNSQEEFREGDKRQISYHFPQEKDKKRQNFLSFFTGKRQNFPSFSPGTQRASLSQPPKDANLELEAAFTYFLDKPGHTLDP